jgi:internalin A
MGDFRFAVNEIERVWKKKQTALLISHARLNNNDMAIIDGYFEGAWGEDRMIGQAANLKYFVENLTALGLLNNQISKLPNFLYKLANLQELTLDQNLIKTIPEDFIGLKNIVELRLAQNEISKFPSPILELSKLESIDLSKNKIRVIPDDIKRLKNLSSLILSGNPIATLPKSIVELENLTHLDLTDTLLPIPPEIIKTKVPKVILDYLFNKNFFVKYPLREAKVIFVGQGSVGKTSLAKRLVSNSFHVLESKTEGISINKWEINDLTSLGNGEQEKIRLNIWDFGGQEIMHATHQFFLTKRSLYLLVLDNRIGEDENRLEYWLKLIQSFGGESPVIIIGNKNDQHALDIDRTGLRKKYLNIIDIVETSAATGDGIETLRLKIAENVAALPHVHDLLPETWFKIKTALEELGKKDNFVTYDEYYKMCIKNKVEDEISQRTLIDFLHDLGIILHFQNEPRLEALGILNPQWVTNGVYKILNSDILFQNKGVLTVTMLDEILNLPEYPRGKRLFIVDMMKKFELCYDIEPDKTFLVPDLLPKDQPDLKFNGVPAFEYAYPVLPSSVITRFIVRMNQKIDDGFVWRTGVVLKIGENKALVKADIEDRKITIAIDGVEYSRRDALSAIRYELGEIHNSIKGLNPQQRVPVPNAPLAEPLKYDYLLKLERSGQEFLPVENGNDLVTVNVRQMLSAIETEAQRKEQGNVINNYYTASDGGIIVGRDLSGNLISGNNNKIIQDSYNKIQSAEIDPELKQTLKSLTEAITTVVQSFPEEKTVKVVKNFERLVEEVTQPEPDKQWYSVSIEGLIKAAENLDKLGTPVISLSRKVLSLLTGGVVK